MADPNVQYAQPQPTQYPPTQYPPTQYPPTQYPPTQYPPQYAQPPPQMYNAPPVIIMNNNNNSSSSSASASASASATTVNVNTKLPVNHCCHFALCFCTGGLWFPVWIIACLGKNCVFCNSDKHKGIGCERPCGA